jgi:hypothetical protein
MQLPFDYRKEDDDGTGLSVISDLDIWRPAMLLSRALLISGAMVIAGMSMAADCPHGDCAVRGLKLLSRSDDNYQVQQQYRDKIRYYCGANLIKGEECDKNNTLISEPVLMPPSTNKQELGWHVFGWKSKTRIGDCSCLIDE